MLRSQALLPELARLDAICPLLHACHDKSTTASALLAATCLLQRPAVT
jgi:hypothetical protein